MKIKKELIEKRTKGVVLLLFILILLPVVSALEFLDNLRYGTTGVGLYDTNKTLIDFLFFFTLFLSINWISLKRVYGKESKERGPLLGIAIVVSLALAIGALKAGLSPSFLIPFMQYIFFFIGVAFTYLIIVWLGKLEKWWAKLLAFLFAFILVWIILNLGSYLLVNGGEFGQGTEGESFWDRTKASLSEMFDSLWAIPGEIIEEETVPPEEPAEEEAIEETPPEEETTEEPPEEDTTEETPPEEVPEDTTEETPVEPEPTPEEATEETPPEDIPKEETSPTEPETLPAPVEPEPTPASEPETPEEKPEEETSAGWYNRMDMWVNKNRSLAMGGTLVLTLVVVFGMIYKFKREGERDPVYLSRDLTNLERTMNDPSELAYIQSLEDYPWK